MEAEIGGRTFLSDVIVGSCMMILSVVCGCAYSLILVTIWRDGELLKMPSYRFMFALGIFDVIQCFPHFVTGIFTIFQSVFSPALAKAMGVLATPAYVAYAMLTIILSFNRFIQIYSPRLDAVLFTGKTLRLWIGFVIVIWLLFAISLGSPWAAIVYLPDSYGWDYDHTLKFSHIVQKIEMYIELSTILFSAVFYIFVIIALYRTRKRFLSRSDSRTEVKILIQAFVITAYCTVLNFFWHNSQAILPLSIWSNLALNMMWILNSGVYPLIYFIVNKAIRERISQRKSVIPTVSMYTRLPHSKRGSSVADAASNCRFIRKHLNGDETLGNAIKSYPKVQFVS